MGKVMTNREWVNSLSNEDFVTWLVGPIEWDSEMEEYKEPHPRLEYLKRTNTNFFSYIRRSALGL